MSADRLDVDEASIEDVAFPIKRARPVLQVALLVIFFLVIPSFFLHPEFWKGTHPRKGDWIIMIMSRLTPVERVFSCITMEIYSLYALTCQIVRPYFGNRQLTIIKAGSLQGFDTWGSVKSVPNDTVLNYAYSKPLIKVRTTMGRLRIPLAGLEMGRPQVQALTDTLEGLVKRRPAR